MEILIAVLSNLPWVNLIGDAITGTIVQPPASVGGLLYDVAQFLSGLWAIGKGGRWIAEKTATPKDDKFWKRYLYWVGLAIEGLSNLASANDPPSK